MWYKIKVIKKNTQEIQAIIKRLEKLLVNQPDESLAEHLKNILETHTPQKAGISPLYITKDYQIYLPDYQTTVEMSHLTKAVYLTFLKEKKPIDLNNLHQYSDTILHFYQSISYRNSLLAMRQTIATLTDLKTRNIYVHLSRIKSAFRDKLPDSVSLYYYVEGPKNEPKRIKLNRKRVIWE